MGNNSCCCYTDDLQKSKINTINTQDYITFIDTNIRKENEFINFVHKIFTTSIPTIQKLDETQKIFVLDFDGPIAEQYIKNNLLNNTFGNKEDILEIYITNYKILVFTLYILYINNVYIVNGSQRITMNNEGNIFKKQMYHILNQAFGINRNILVQQLSEQISYNINPKELNSKKVILLDRYYNHFKLYNDKLDKKNIFLIDDNSIYKESIIKSGYSFILCNRHQNEMEDNYYLVEMLNKGLNYKYDTIQSIIMDLNKQFPQYYKYIYKLFDIYNYHIKLI